jgi:hypothetical protein
MRSNNRTVHATAPSMVRTIASTSPGNPPPVLVTLTRDDEPGA